jgi:hypothetical protein
MAELASAAGYRTASGIQRYEEATDRGGKWIGIEVVERLATALKGRGAPPITETEVFLELAGALPPRLVGPAGRPNLHATSTKPTRLPDGKRGVSLLSEEGVEIKFAVTKDVIRSLRDDLDFLEPLIDSH